MREAVNNSLVKHRISTDVALRDIVNKGFEAGIGLMLCSHRSTYRCGGSVGITTMCCSPNFPFNLTLALMNLPLIFN